MNKKLAVLVSGKGSLLGAMIDSNLPIALVLADRGCPGIDIAQKAGVETIVLDRNDFKKEGTFDRARYTQAVTNVLKEEGIDLIAMAGFMTVFAPEIFTHYEGRILNSHPSLLPKYKGEHAVQEALDSGDEVTGTTIHVATEALDDGKILAQETVPILSGDTVEKLWERIKVVERKLYPATIKTYIETL